MQLDLQPIIDRQKELERVIRELTARIAQAPPGHLVISKRGGGLPTQYYHEIPTGQESSPGGKRVYIRKEDNALAKDLANKGYYKLVLHAAKEEHRIISRFLKLYPKKRGEDIGEDIYSKMAKERQALTEPFWEPAEAFVERWLHEEYPRKSFREDDPYYVTERGERVRSKSELIIANWLFQHGIPYRYECALELWDPHQPRRITIYPDFTILDPATGKCFYLEHFGMMDDEHYFRTAMDRLALYEANGYFVGESLLLSFESDKVPLDVRALGRRVEHALGQDAS